MDYIIKYHSLNGARFLFQNGFVKFQAAQNRLNFSEQLWLAGDEQQHFELIKMIFELDDEEMFANAFDIISSFNIYDRQNFIPYKDDFIKLCLDSKNIFKHLIKWYKIDLKLINPNLVNIIYSTTEMYTSHPLLNYMIKYAISNNEIYHDKLVEMLNNASNNNYHVVNHIKNEIGLLSLNQLKVNENGCVVDDYCNLGIIATYDLPIDPDLDVDIKKRLNELKACANQITFSDSYNWDGTLKTQWLRKDDAILRKSSNNVVEYEMLKKMKELGYNGVPKLISSENSIDKFEYIEGYNSDKFNIYSKDFLLVVADYFKEFHSICKKELNGKIYCHNSLSIKDLIFNDDKTKLKAIINWKNCSVGEITDDLIYVIVNWIDLDNRFFYEQDDKKLDIIKTFIQEYGSEVNVKKDLGQKIMSYLNAALNKLDKNDKNFKAKFYKCKESLIFVELYFDQLNNM